MTTADDDDDDSGREARRYDVAYMCPNTLSPAQTRSLSKRCVADVIDDGCGGGGGGCCDGCGGNGINNLKLLSLSTDSVVLYTAMTLRYFIFFSYLKPIFDKETSTTTFIVYIVVV